MKPDLSIIIPVYNESECVEKLWQALDGYLANIQFSVEIVFVDDGSTDDSLEKLSSVIFNNASVKIVKLSKNYGTHTAFRAGIANASAENCLFYFMDISDAPSIIGDFYELLGQGNDIIYGIRDGYKPSLFSRAFSQLLRRFVVPGYPKDGISGVAFNSKIKNQLNQNVEGNSSIYLQIFNMGFRQKGVVCQFHDREIGVSKWTFKKKVKLMVDTFVSFSYIPIRISSVLGLIMTLVSIIWGFTILVIKLFDLFPMERGFPTLNIVILFGFGITNISISMMSEYLVRTLDAARRRPVYIVDEVMDINQ